MTAAAEAWSMIVWVAAFTLSGCLDTPNEETDPWMGAELLDAKPPQGTVPLSTDGPQAYQLFLTNLDGLITGEEAKISCTMRDQDYETVTGHLAKLEREATGQRGAAPGPFYVEYKAETLRLHYGASALGDLGAPVDYCLED